MFFREFDPKKAFVLMGSVIMCSSVLSLFVQIPGEGKCFFLSSDEQVDINKLGILTSPSKTMTEVESNSSSSPTTTSQNLESYFPIDAGHGSDIDVLQI